MPEHRKSTTVLFEEFMASDEVQHAQPCEARPIHTALVAAWWFIHHVTIHDTDYDEVRILVLDLVEAQICIDMDL